MTFNGNSLGASNYPYRGAKSSYYEGGIRVPSFIHIPNFQGNHELEVLCYSLANPQANSSFTMKLTISGKGVHYKGLFHITDWFTTLISLVKIIKIPDEEREKLDGVDHAGKLQGGCLY